MSILHPPSDQRPGNQSSKTPSGAEVPTAMSMMVDSMVRMIQKANKNKSDIDNEVQEEDVNGN